MESESRKKTNRAINTGLSFNTGLAVSKIVFGIFGNSAALLADGINSVSDVIYYIVVKVFIHISYKPADDEHPYGHRQMESIAALVVGAFVITTAVAIFWNSINTVFRIVSGTEVSDGVKFVSLVVALITIVIKIGLTYFTYKVGNKEKSAAIMALAHDHRNDIFAGTGALVGIILARLGIPWGDPIAGAIVSVIIFLTGLQILRESSDELMDTLPSKSLDEEVRLSIKKITEVKEIESIHAHRFGPYFVINVTICISGDITVTQGDEIATQVENQIYGDLEMVRMVYVHYHPFSKNPNLS